MTSKRVHDLYENDSFLWYNENAKLIREKKFDQIDIENIAEELESMGKNERKMETNEKTKSRNYSKR